MTKGESQDPELGGKAGAEENSVKKADEGVKQRHPSLVRMTPTNTL
jgi:hypothetical protein